VAPWKQQALRAGLLTCVAFLAIYAERNGPSVWTRALGFLPVLLALGPACALLQKREGFRRQRAFVWTAVFTLTSIGIVVGESPPQPLPFLILCAVVACSRTLLGGALVGGLGATLLTLSLHQDWPDLAAALAPAPLFLLSGLVVGYLSSAADQAWEETATLREELADQAEQINNVLACVASGVLVVDERGRLLTYNRAAERILGVLEHKALGRELDSVEGLAPLTQVLSVGAPPPDSQEAELGRSDLHFTRPDGQTIYVGYAVSPLENRAGRRLGQILVFQDVTLIRDYADRMLRQEQLAALGRMVSGIAHEFGNILGGARGLIGMAREETPEEAVQTLPMVQETLDRALETVDNLLRFARGTPLNRIPGVKLEAVIERALLLLKADLDQANIQVETRVEDGVAPVEADAVQLEQVFINVIINSIHALEDLEDRRLRITVRAHNGHAQVLFEDSGPGISPEVRDQIFEPFFTTKGSFASGEVPGTGLGLSIAIGVIEGHEGTIEISTSPELKGACFTITLPSTNGEALAST
jgi:PAS domain S-box-containing protein